MLNRLSFGKRLRSLRIEQGLTQEKLADLIDANSADTISRYENGKNFPYPDKLAKLVKALNITYNELLDPVPIKKKHRTLTEKIQLELSHGFSNRDLKIILAQIVAFKQNKK